MLSFDGWFDFATRMPGPPLKRYAQQNAIKGYVAHSAVGSTQGVIDVVFGPAQKSVHGTIDYQGNVIQFYSIHDSCWASGNEYVNTHFVAFENEGGRTGPNDEFIEGVTNELLTIPQIHINAQIIIQLALAGWWLWPPVRPVSPFDLKATLWEHRELTRFGVAPTACPSNRIPWSLIMESVQDSSAQDLIPSIEKMLGALMEGGVMYKNGWNLKELDEKQKVLLEWFVKQLR